MSEKINVRAAPLCVAISARTERSCHHRKFARIKPVGYDAILGVGHQRRRILYPLILKHGCEDWKELHRTDLDATR